MPDAPLISVSGAPLVIFNTTVAPLLSIGDVPDTLAMVSAVVAAASIDSTTSVLAFRTLREIVPRSRISSAMAVWMAHAVRATASSESRMVIIYHRGL